MRPLPAQWLTWLRLREVRDEETSHGIRNRMFGAFGVLARPLRAQPSAARQSMLETLPVSVQILSELTPPILRSKAINLRISFGDSA